MASLAAQIIDQRISGIVERQADSFSAELGLGADEQRRRSAAFTFLVARTVYDLTDDEALGSEKWTPIIGQCDIFCGADS